MELNREELNGCKSNQSQRAGDFYKKLSPAAFRDLTSMESPQSYAANVVLFAEKQSSKGVCVVLDGEVRLSMNSSDGRRLSLRIARKGEIVGLSSALSDRPYEFTAETLYSSKVAFISRRDLMDFLERHPEVYPAVIEELSRHVTLACDQLRTVGLSTSAPEKLARLLLDWSDDQSKESGGRVRFSMTHEEIGQFIGSSRETVTRTLSTFKSRQFVVFQGSMMTINSRTALESYMQKPEARQ